jgi:hypothetical protein
MDPILRHPKAEKRKFKCFLNLNSKMLVNLESAHSVPYSNSYRLGPSGRRLDKAEMS